MTWTAPPPPESPSEPSAAGANLWSQYVSALTAPGPQPPRPRRLPVPLAPPGYYTFKEAVERTTTELTAIMDPGTVPMLERVERENARRVALSVLAERFSSGRVPLEVLEHKLDRCLRVPVYVLYAAWNEMSPSRGSWTSSPLFYMAMSDAFPDTGTLAAYAGRTPLLPIGPCDEWHRETVDLISETYGVEAAATSAYRSEPISLAKLRGSASRWLRAKMVESPDRLPERCRKKADVIELMRTECPGLSRTAADEVWQETAAAVEASGVPLTWRRPGAPSKGENPNP